MALKKFWISILFCTLLAGAAQARSTVIDARNADTLKMTIQAIAADMSELERKQFGQDVMLINMSSVRGLGRLRERDLFWPRYSVIFSSGPELFSEMALEAGEELDGKTAGLIKKYADSLRSEWYSIHLKSLEADRNKVKLWLDAIPPRIKEYRALNSELEPRSKRYKIARSKAVILDELTAELGVNYNFVRGSATVKNMLDVPFSEFYVIVSFEFPSIPGYVYQRSFGIKLEEELAPGKVASNILFEDRNQQRAVRKEIPRENLTPKDVLNHSKFTDKRMAIASSVEFSAYHQASEIIRYSRWSEVEYPDGSTHNSDIEKCEKIKTDFIELIRNYDSIIERVSSAVINPKPINIRAPNLSFYKAEC